MQKVVPYIMTKIYLLMFKYRRYDDGLWFGAFVTSES